MSQEPKDTPLTPAIFVIFGITGDLAQRKLLPALYHLIKDNLLDEHTVIVGVSRRAMPAEELLKHVELCVLEADNVCDPVTLRKFHRMLRMVRLDPVNGEHYARLRGTLDAIEADSGVCMNRLFYLSIPPQVYEPVIAHLGEHGLHEGCQHNRGPQKKHASLGATHKHAVSRLLVEKPFGYDLPSAKELVASTAHYFAEDQVFRIDHYLAKETVQNILVFRAQNPLFHSVWCSDSIARIDVLLSEQIGVEGRANFYDNVGALRDVVQNHVLQLLALVTMELPASMSDSAALHQAKQRLLSQIAPVDMRSDAVRRGQYHGYREEVGNPHSTTETFVSLPVFINNQRWEGVPITLTAGKALASKATSVSVTFAAGGLGSNKLAFRIQPNEGIDLELTVKRPGFEKKTELVQMDFSYRGAFAEPQHPDAYERVLVDAVRGDHSLFATSGEIIESWRILQPILDAWQQDTSGPAVYAPGSAGPGDA